MGQTYAKSWVLGRTVDVELFDFIRDDGTVKEDSSSLIRADRFGDRVWVTCVKPHAQDGLFSLKDWITHLNGKPVTSLTDIRRRCNKAVRKHGAAPGNAIVHITIRRFDVDKRIRCTPVPENPAATAPAATAPPAGYGDIISKLNDFMESAYLRIGANNTNGATGIVHLLGGPSVPINNKDVFVKLADGDNALHIHSETRTGKSILDQYWTVFHTEMPQNVLVGRDGLLVGLTRDTKNIPPGVYTLRPL